MQRIPIRLRLAALAVLLALGAQSLTYAVAAGRQYTVKPGDTLGAISLSIGVPPSRLAELNNLADVDHIVAGQTLLLPDDANDNQSSVPTGQAASSQSADLPRTDLQHTVRTGDVLSRIAREYRVSPAAIVAANQLEDPDRLSVGQKLIIPGGRPVGSPNGSAASASASPASDAGSSTSQDLEPGALLEATAGRYKLDPALVKALAWYLSGWRTDASNPGGAVGLMQITSSAQEWVGQSILKRAADRNNPTDNVELGVAYLSYLVNKLGDERQGVAAYLQGPASVARNGVLAGTAKALETIYGSKGRFSSTGGALASRAATPTATPDLTASVMAAARAVSSTARIGVAGRKLATGERLDIRSGEAFPSASVIKAGILTEAFRQISAGTLQRTATIDDDLERMITLSDNDAANRLISSLGQASINGTMANLGLGSTVLHNLFAAGPAPSNSGFNQTSPADMAALFSTLAGDKLVGPNSSKQMRDLLKHNQDTSKLVRGVPAGVAVAHKSGWYPGVANDVGIVYAPRGTYVLAVFSQGVADNEAGNQLIAAISRAVYDAWGR